MKVMKNTRWVLALALPLVVGTANAATSLTDGKYWFSASGVVEPSWPLFLDNSETIKVERKGSGSTAYWRLTGTGSSSTFWGGLSNFVTLGNESVKYQANFNAAGRLITSIGTTSLSNYLEIKGSLAAGTFGDTSWGNQPYQTLLKADLLDADPADGAPGLIGTYQGVGLGFNTKFTGGWAPSMPGLTGGSTGESLWLFASPFNSGFKDLVNALDGNKENGTLSNLIGSSDTIKNVSSVASVPVPGAVWLFGTGLATLLAGRRKHAGVRLAA